MRLLGVQLCSRGLLLYRILAYIKMHCLQTVEIGAKNITQTLPSELFECIKIATKVL